MTIFHSQVFVCLILCASLCMFSCKESKPMDISGSSYIEILDIYRASNDGKSAKKDSLLYKEEATFENGKKTNINYYNPDGSIKGVEKISFDAAGVELGASYKDNQDTLLSYYKYIIDNKGRKVSSTAFEGTTDELLRVENYKYDGLGYLNVKEIFDANQTLQRRYTFRNNEKGEPIEMCVLSSQNDTIAIEKYEMTKFDDQKRWTEKWGFINGEPKTCHIRTFRDTK